MKLKTVGFIKENNNWLELLKQAPYNLIINEDENYYLLKYNQLESDFSNDIVKECRGLIISKKTLKPMALSFKKFFNYGEPEADELDWNSVRVQEKVDGSKILTWFGEDEQWHISTSGTIDAFKANVSNFGFTFGDLFINALNSNELEFNNKYGICIRDGEDFLIPILDSSICYTFELVSPKARIVVSYEKDDIYLIGARDLISLEEIDPSQERISNYVKQPKSYPLHTLADCIEATKLMGYDEEGFVAVDNKWDRIKIKSPAWIVASHLKNNNVQSVSRLLELVERNEQAEFLTYFPEWSEDIHKIEGALDDFKSSTTTTIEVLQSIINSEDSISRKDLANFIMSSHKDISKFLFAWLDRKQDITPLDFVNRCWDILTESQKLNYLKSKL